MTKDSRSLVPVDPSGLEDIAIGLLNSTTTEKPQDEGVSVKANINPKDYIRIPNTKILIAKQETHKGKNWEETIYALGNEGLFMPSPAIFIPYFLKIKEANEGKSTLYDGSNNPISIAEIGYLYKYMTSGHRGGCWIWLDAKFMQDKASWYVESNHSPIKNNKGLNSTKLPLEACLREDAYVNLSFNSQGLATSKSPNQNYVQGSNIYFYHPRENCVAGFRADSDWVNLYCGGDPQFTNAGLGVFACAEGTDEKNKGVK